MADFLYDFQTQGQLQPWDDREWLLTDGTGSFAMGTVSGVNTRRYHSTLVAATKPPVGRINLVPRVGEILLLDGQEALHELSACRFGNNVHPQGYRHLRRFRLGSVAEWTYEVSGVTVTKTLSLPDHSCSAVLTYDVRFDSGRWVELLLLPMVALRDFHALRRHAGWNMGRNSTHDSVRVDADNLAVTLTATNAKYEDDPDWWFGQTYAIETERGQDDTEDLFKPGVFRATLQQSKTITLTIRPDPAPRPVGEAFRAISYPSHASPNLRRLFHSTKDFLIRRRTPTGSSGTSILAGFPWFADWGRDTFISLPGLLLETGRLDEAADVLSTFAHYVSGGMIPNKFDDYDNSPAYNTVDASLWFIHSAHAYLKRSGNTALFDQHLAPACREIIRGYREGTMYNIAMDPSDSLITQGDATTQLTWMDAKYQGKAFTPRQGKAVEINALWYNALMLLREESLAAKVAESFRQQFWISPFRGLYDVVDGSRKDASVRPNQIFAVSLPFSPLTAEQQKAVVEVVRRELLTPMGLRTLSPSDPNYHPTYGGPQSQRDAAYHNGTVWAWLIGPFIDAHLRIHGDTKEAREEARRLLSPLLQHLEQACVGHVSEIFEAQPLHRPVGASAQAWSLAELLRVSAKVGI
jgi:predicted glycogen debranching enzyme